MNTALMLLNAPYPEDIRLKKEIGTLAAKGYKIHLLCIRRPTEITTETIDGCTIHRINAGLEKYQLAFWDVLMSLFFVHPYFLVKAKRIIKQGKIELLHVHDLPLMGTALSLKKSSPQIKVVFDMHENYPEALPLWFSWKKGFVTRLKNRLFMSTKRWLKWERNAVEGADAILTVVDEMKATLVAKYGRSSKVVVVSNTESPSFLSAAIDSSVYSAFEGKFIITYTGGIGPHRGVDTVIEAMALIPNKQAIFVVVGGGSGDAVTELRRQINKLGLQDRVFLLGHRPASTVPSYMRCANVNIIPHKKNAQNDNGVPHKLFQNMLAGRPLLVSSSPPLQRIVRETDCGLVFEAENPRALAEKIMELYHNPFEATRLANNGFIAASTGRYTWKNSAEVLCSVYSKLSKLGGE
jgi:glycosyltransferase involved in cell wall biosynthesis